MKPGRIPRELRDLPQWVLWRTEVREGKPTKVPYSIKGAHARANDPKTWATFEEVVAIAGDGYDGVGFMFTKDDPYCGVDLDDCRDPDTGEFHKDALAVIEKLDSYAEVSPSDTGAKIIVKAKKPGTRNRTGKTPWGGDVEMYDERRYFAITGNALNGPEVREAQADLDDLYGQFFGEPQADEKPKKKGAPTVDIEDEEVLERAKDHRHFRDLWDGNTERYGNDRSAADLAFTATLARITDDREQIERLWKASGLAREKLDRDDYVTRTIDKAMQDVRPTFEALEEQNDAGNAKRIVAEHGHDLRYSGGLGWLVWDGTRWKPDNLGGAQRRAEESSRRLFHGVDKMTFHDDRARVALKRFAKRSMNAGAIENALKVVSWQSAIRMADESFDSMPGFLNVLNGTLDLATLDLAEHDRNSLITRLAPTEYDPSARSDVWDAFIERILPDEELRRFVQRCAGYSLAGNPTEKVLMFAHGPRDTGKSTFLDSIEHVLGDYAQTADFSTFIVKTGGRASNDLARMRGVRFVKSLEVDEGEKMAAGVVKALTGGDTIAARFLYKEHFEFKMEGVLWLAANARPKVDAADDAMWRRILHVPFVESIPKDEQDPTLGSKLRTPEARRAILAWLVDGFIEYRDRRIDPPKIVTDYTEEYRHEMNPLADFFDTWCVMGHTADFEPWQAIKEHVQRWADDERRRVPGDVQVKAALRAAGCVDERRYIDGARVRGWSKIRLVEPVGQ